MCCSESDVAEGSPPNAQRGQTSCVAVPRKPIEEGVSGGVATATDQPEKRGGRRVQNEHVERLIAGELVEVPRSSDLR